MKTKSVLHSIDFLFGIGSLITFIIFWSQLGKLNDQVKIMPKIVMLIGIISAIIIIIRSLRNPVENTAKQYDRSRYIISGFIVFAVVSLLLWFSETIGMFLSLFLSLLVLSCSICIKEKYFDWKRIGLFALYDLAVTVVLFIFFHVFLSIDTPSGFLI